MRLSFPIILAVAACSPQTTGNDPEQGHRVAAPTPVDIRYRFDEGYDGQTVAVPAGESFALEMRSWAEWTVAEVPPFLSPGKPLTGPTEDAGLTGSDYWQISVFETREVGEGVIRLVLARPWDPESILDEFTLKVRVVPAQQD